MDPKRVSRPTPSIGIVDVLAIFPIFLTETTSGTWEKKKKKKKNSEKKILRIFKRL